MLASLSWSKGNMMEISFYQALKAANVSNEVAEKAVKALQEEIAMQVSNAVAPVLAKLDIMNEALQLRDKEADRKLDSLGESFKTQFSYMRWILGGIGAAIVAGLCKVFFL